jgi:Ca2+-binding EF-hand superfamily protein
MRLTLVLLPLLAVGSVQAADQSPAAPQPAMHEQMKEHWTAADRDGNGTLSREEATASMPHVAENFDKIDANHDGQVSHDEMRAFHQAQGPRSPEEMQQHFKSADRNGDGAIDLAEAKAGMPKLAEHFADVDTNKDGKVTPDEMKAHHQRMHPEAPPAPSAPSAP